MARRWKWFLVLILLGILVVQATIPYWYPKKESRTIPRDPPPVEWFAAYAEACQKHGGLPDERSVCEGLWWNLNHSSAYLSENDKKRLTQLSPSCTQQELLEIDLVRGLVKNLTKEGVIWPYAFVNEDQRDRLILYLRQDKPTSDSVIEARRKLHEINGLFRELQQEFQGATPPENAPLLRWVAQARSSEFPPRQPTSGPLIPAFDSIEAEILLDMIRFWNLPQAYENFPAQTYPLLYDGQQILVPPTRLQKYKDQLSQQIAAEQKAHPEMAPLYRKLRNYIQACSAVSLQ